MAKKSTPPKDQPAQEPGLLEATLQELLPRIESLVREAWPKMIEDAQDDEIKFGITFVHALADENVVKFNLKLAYSIRTELKAECDKDLAQGELPI